VRSALLAAGLTPEQLAAAAAREPRLFTFRRACFIWRARRAI
jgi:hypothetical protein